jgi:hypothetical protein
MTFKKLFQDEGKLSLKRVLGALMLGNGLIGKDILCVCAGFFDVKNFELIDSSLTDLMIFGTVLITGVVIEKLPFFPRGRKTDEAKAI